MGGAALAIVLVLGGGCVSSFNCMVVCVGSTSTRDLAGLGLSPANPSEEFEPLRPMLRVGEKVLMTFGAPADGRRYRGRWGATDGRVLRVRSWRGECGTTCAEVEAVEPGDASVLFRFEGGLMDWSNPVHVE